jgi:nucleoid-associated protein YgaU/proteasome lid subunit RPN8/RPN11
MKTRTSGEKDMDKGTPDISQIDNRDLKAGSFPGPDERAFRISITETAYGSVREHAAEDTAIEICGVLVGEVRTDEKGPFLIITAAIRGENAATQAGQVTFTQEAWSHILEIKDAAYPELRIVGWYHSHPTFGIFISSQDQFIQTTLFSQPWQVAFVVDPISGDEGFFVWHKGGLARVGRYWVDGLSRSAAEHADPGPKVVQKVEELLAAVPKPGADRSLPLYAVVSLLLVGLLCVGVYLSVRSANEGMLASVDRLVNAIAWANGAPGASADSRLLYEAARRLMQNPLVASLKIQVGQANGRIWCRGEVYTQAQKELVGQIIKSVPDVGSVDLEGLAVTHLYQVAEGDTLEKVALRVYGDDRKWERIYRANPDLIKDPKKISPPLTLRIPE